MARLTKNQKNDIETMLHQWEDLMDKKQFNVGKFKAWIQSLTKTFSGSEQTIRQIIQSHPKLLKELSGGIPSFPRNLPHPSGGCCGR